MNEKICQNCGKQNPLDMNFCLDCGQPLPIGGTAPSFPGEFAPTVFAPPSVRTNFQPTPTPNFAQPAAKKSRAGFWLAIIGGIGLIGALIVVGIVGLVAANWNKIADESNSQNRAVNLNAPTPRRAANSTVNSANPTPAETVAAKTPATDGNTTTAAVPRVEHDRLWVDHDVKENGKTGMRVHAKFTAYNMKGVDSHLAVYFSRRDGEKLMTSNKTYATTEGQVAAFRPMKPEYDPAVFSDVSVFIPYTELKLGKGKYDLKLNASIIYGKGGLIQHLEDYDFDYTF